MDDDVFMIQARKCKRCGRLLVNHDAIERGYGCQCERLVRQEKMDRQPVPGQIGLFDFFEKKEIE